MKKLQLTGRGPLQTAVEVTKGIGRSVTVSKLLVAVRLLSEFGGGRVGGLLGESGNGYCEGRERRSEKEDGGVEEHGDWL